MNASTSRSIFAALCLLGLIAILCVTLWEVGRQRRGHGTITPRHFRWRLISAILWTIVLGALGYSTLFLWPDAHDSPAVRRFGLVLVYSMGLMLVAFGITLFDFFLTAKARQLGTARLQIDLAIARQEIERVQAEAKEREDGEHNP